MSVVLLTEPFSGGGSGSGTVTSVDVSGGTTGLTTSGGPVTTAGVITLGGTLAVANGGTGTATPALVAGTNVTITGTWPNQTINSSGGGGGGSPAGSNTQIQFNAAGAFGASPSLYWDGFTLFVGDDVPVGGLTNPIAAFVQSSPNYIQAYIHNNNSGANASSDFVMYPDNGSDSAGWGDIGVNSSGFADSAYAVTGPNETYLFASGTAGKTGNLVYATDSTGTTNAHQWYVGGFTQAKSAWKMQLTSSGLQLSTALSIANGGTGQTTANAALNALLPSQTGNVNYYLKTDGTNTSWAAVSGTGTVTSVSVTSGNGLAGTVTNPTTTPAISLSTTVTGLLKGNGTAISAASAGTDYLAPPSGTSILKGNSGGALANAVAGTDYQAPITLTTTGTSGAATFIGNTLNVPNYASGGTVTSVSGTGTVNGITLTGTVTSTGNLTLGGTLSGVDLSTQVTGNLPVTNLNSGTSASSSTFWRGDGTWAVPTGSGTVTSVSVVTANGLAGTVSNPTTTPAITLSTSVSGLLKGNGTAISAATAGTDYQSPITLTTTGTSGAATFVGNTLNIPQYSGGGGTPGGSDTQIQFNNSGSFGGSANFIWDGTNVQLGAQGALRFADADSTNYVAFKSPATVASNVTWTLPSADGTSAQVLSTNGAGTLAWVTQSGGGGGGSPNLDGGTPTSNYGGITAIDGGTP